MGQLKFIKFSLAVVFLLLVAACGTGGDDEQGSGSDITSQLSFEAEFTGEDETGTFDLKLTNNSEEEVAIAFSSGQQYEIVVNDSEGEEVYRYSEGQMFTQALIEETIEPGGELTWIEEWDYTGTEGRLEEGEYEAIVSLIVHEINGETVDSVPFFKTLSITVPETVEEEPTEDTQSDAEDAEEEVEEEEATDQNGDEETEGSLREVNRDDHENIRNIGITGEQGEYRVTGETNVEGLQYNVEDGHFILVLDTDVALSGTGEWQSFDFTINIEEDQLPDYGALSLVFSWEENGERQYHGLLLEDFNEY